MTREARFPVSRAQRMRYRRYRLLLWLKAPWRCKRGMHVVSASPDFFFLELGSGVVDAECARCGAVVRVPLEDYADEFISLVVNRHWRRMGEL